MKTVNKFSHLLCYLCVLFIFSSCGEDVNPEDEKVIYKNLIQLEDDRYAYEELIFNSDGTFSGRVFETLYLEGVELNLGNLSLPPQEAIVVLTTEGTYTKTSTIYTLTYPIINEEGYVKLDGSNCYSSTYSDQIRNHSDFKYGIIELESWNNLDFPSDVCYE